MIKQRFVIKILKSLSSFLLIMISSYNHSASGQNLITNPSFEQFRTCPQDANTELVAGHQIIPRWHTPSPATPDYFNACSRGNKVSVPENFAGNMPARTGDGYIGLILKSDITYYHGSPYYTEHIQNRLSRALRPGKYYCFEVWISLGKNSTIAARDFGVYFSRNRVTFPNYTDTLPRAHIEYQAEEYLTNSEEWFPLRGVYKAEGGERFVTMGNFYPWIASRFIRLRHHFKPGDLREFAYYIFDDASLIEVEDPSDCDCNMVAVEPPQSNEELETETETEYEKIEIGETVVLQNIFFEFDKADLLPESFPELNKLVELMKKHPQMKIKISGHTDFKGSAEYNLKLSDDRAGSVVKYLIENGVNPKNLSAKGYGKTKPIADNTTEEGRQKNRRVEFTIISK